MKPGVRESKTDVLEKMKCAAKATSVAAFTVDTSYRTNPGATYNQPFMGKSAATTITESKRA
jgi:hypothetical protein